MLSVSLLDQIKRLLPCRRPLLQTADCWLLATGCLLLAVGASGWLPCSLAIGCWLAGKLAHLLARFIRCAVPTGPCTPVPTEGLSGFLGWVLAGRPPGENVEFSMEMSTIRGDSLSSYSNIMNDARR